MISKEELIKLFKECNFAHGDYEILIDKIVQALTAKYEPVCQCGNCAECDEIDFQAEIAEEEYQSSLTAEDEQWVDRGWVLDENNAKLYYKEALTAEDEMRCVACGQDIFDCECPEFRYTLTAEDEPITNEQYEHLYNSFGVEFSKRLYHEYALSDTDKDFLHWLEGRDMRKTLTAED